MRMTSVKEVYQSFCVLPDNPRYLKDKRRKNRVDNLNNHEETGGDEPDPTKRDSLDSGPFQISFLAPGTGALEMVPPG